MSKKEDIIKKLTELQIKGDDLAWDRQELEHSMSKGNAPLGSGAMLKLYDKAQDILSEQITPLYDALEKIEKEEWKSKH